MNIIYKQSGAKRDVLSLLQPLPPLSCSSMTDAMKAGAKVVIEKQR
jgi:hypothetical protein